MHFNDEMSAHVHSLIGAACIGDWSRANLCRDLMVPLCFIRLMQILFPHYIEINYIDIKKNINKTRWTHMVIQIYVRDSKMMLQYESQRLCP